MTTEACDGRTNAHPHCSRDRVRVSHGYLTPALACGFHINNFPTDVFAGHLKRMENHS